MEEFTVWRDIFASIAWTKRRESGFVIQQSSISRFSVIAAIKKFKLRTSGSITKNTNGNALNEFIKLKPPFFKIRKFLKGSFLGLQAWFPKNETLIQ